MRKSARQMLRNNKVPYIGEMNLWYEFVCGILLFCISGYCSQIVVENLIGAKEVVCLIIGAIAFPSSVIFVSDFLWRCSHD